MCQRKGIIPNQRRDTFENVLVEVRITWVLGDNAQDSDQPVQEGLICLCEGHASSDNDTHDTYAPN